MNAVVTALSTSYRYARTLALADPDNLALEKWVLLLSKALAACSGNDNQTQPDPALN